MKRKAQITTVSNVNKKSVWKQMAARWQIYVLLVIPIALLLIFNYGPMAGVIIAFKDFSLRKGIWDSPWVGFENFEKLFTSFKFPLILKNTVILSLYSFAASFPLPIVLALCLNAMRGRRYKKVIQTVTYMPHFISTVVMVGLLYSVLSNRSGLYGTVYTAFTGEIGPNILGEPKAFRHLYVWSDVWKNTGYAAVIYIAALANVDVSLHQAAEMDGASRFQRLLYIDLPTIMPSVSILMILEIGKIMSVGAERVLLMQNTLNMQYSEVISTYVYKMGVASGASNDYSFSAAVGLFNSVVNLILLLVSNKISDKVSGNAIF